MRLPCIQISVYFLFRRQDSTETIGDTYTIIFGNGVMLQVWVLVRGAIAPHQQAKTTQVELYSSLAAMSFNLHLGQLSRTAKLTVSWKISQFSLT